MAWIVMTAAAKTSYRRGVYRRVALVELTPDYAAQSLLPKMISPRAKGVIRLVDLGRHSVGKTSRAAYQRTLAEAERQVTVLNRTPIELHNTLLQAWEQD